MDIEATFLEVASWCDARAPISDLRFGLRSAELEPHVTERPESNELDVAVHYVANRRHQLLVSRTVDDYTSGQVLVCQYNMSITSGESEEVTRGFFDVADRPPWETWWSGPGVQLQPADSGKTWLRRAVVVEAHRTPSGGAHPVRSS